MFGRKYQQRLDELDEQVQIIQSEVPMEARSFQRQCDGIRRSLRELGSKWIFSRDTEQLHRLETKVDKLAALSGELTNLIRSRQETAERVHRLCNVAANLDTEEGRQVMQRCDQWIRVLEGLGSDVDQSSHLQLDQSKALDLQNEVHDYASTVDLLAKAETLVHGLGSMDAPALQAGILKSKEEFRNFGPSAQRLSELANLLEPIERQVPQPPVPRTKTSEDLGRLFEEWREWTRVLDNGLDSKLEDSYRRLNQMQATADDTQSLLRELSAELEKLRQRASSERFSRLSDLRQDVIHFRRACGDNGSLDTSLEQLESNPANTFQNYQQWLNQYENFDRIFSNIAQARENVLSSHLEKQRAALEERRQSLIAGPLSSISRMAVGALGGPIAQLSKASGQMAIRAALRVAEQLSEKISEVGKQAREELAAFNLRKSTLLDKLKDLEGAATTLDMPAVRDQCAASLQQIDQENIQSNDLDQKNILLDGTGKTFDALLQTFLENCCQLLDELFAYCREAHNAVAMASEGLGRAVPERKFSRMKPPLMTPGDAQRNCQMWIQLRESYWKKMTELSGLLKQAAREAQGHLQKIMERPGYLSPGQLDQGAELIRDLSESDSTQTDDKDPLPGFTSLAILLDRYKTFIRLVEGGREELQKSLDILKNRLRKFSEDNFNRRFPEAAERVSALVYGIDPDTVYVETKKPLHLAGKLLDVMEAQGRRLAAEELENACRDAEVYLRTSGQPRADELRSTLQEIQEFSPHRLAPSSLRRRLLQYLDLVGGNGRA
ncbi:MAG TPA: hypothetical protein VG759_02070 [Candidatus Angelobacter sp.]|nr:hypothetical protein [Candidatus Angelobacter sp.]